VPPEIGDRFTPEHRAWLRNTDWYLPELYEFLPQLGVTTIVATHSRYVVDLNRDPAGPLYGNFFRALIARESADGAPIYSAPDGPRDHAAVVAAYHAPYHAALRQALDETAANFGRALLLDLHSFMGPTEHDVCIGDCHGRSCTPSTADAFERALREQGLDVSRNEPFGGGYITRHYGLLPRCEALQLELRYPTYLDCTHIDEPGRPGLDPVRISAAQRKLRPALEKVLAATVAR
jgi:N-formylglutamate amidohydrolase